MKICAIDPGRAKSGIAVLDYNKKIYFRKILKTSELLQGVGDLKQVYDIEKVVLGKGTARSIVFDMLKNDFSIEFIDEKFSTLEARGRYWKENPVKGWRKFIPRGLLLPPAPYDDYSAVILGERYIEAVARR